jgi:hypothetical protein
MQPLREDIDELGSRRGVEDAKLFDNDMLADEVEINLNILALILDMVGGEVHHILAIDQGDPRRGRGEAPKEVDRASMPLTLLAMVQYSTSTLEWEMTFWHFKDQEMKWSPRNTTYPEVNQQVFE